MSNAPVQLQLRHRFLQAQGQCFSLDVELELPGAGISAIFGHSGCGKTSILRCMAGLLRADDCILRVGGETWQDAQAFVPPHRRPVGYVFQEASLFDHLDVAGNLNFACARATVDDVGPDFDQVVSIMELGGLLARDPSQLSGGERQRVAIARALLIKPRLLLMDEPLASLDTRRKSEILPFLERLRESVDLPVVYVTHSLDEVARLADHLVVLEGGSVQAAGSVTSVLGDISLPLQNEEQAGVVIAARITEKDGAWGLMKALFDGGELWLPDTGEPTGTALRLRILARDVSVTLQAEAGSSILNRVPATVVELREAGDAANEMVKLKAGDTTFVARLTRKSVHALGLETGKAIWAQFKSVAVVR